MKYHKLYNTQLLTDQVAISVLFDSAAEDIELNKEYTIKYTVEALTKHNRRLTLEVIENENEVLR